MPPEVFGRDDGPSSLWSDRNVGLAVGGGEQGPSQRVSGGPPGSALFLCGNEVLLPAGI